MKVSKSEKATVKKMQKIQRGLMEVGARFARAELRVKKAEEHLELVRRELKAKAAEASTFLRSQLAV